MKKYLGIGAIAIGVLLLLSPVGLDVLGGSTSLTKLKCTTNTVSSVAVGNELTTTVLPAYSNRAWARIQVADGEVEPIFLSFDEGADATVDNGLALTATSTTFIDFGLNVEFPYVGAVTAITGSASTTVLITECRY